MIFTLVLLIFSSHKYGQDTVGSLASLVQEYCLITSAIVRAQSAGCVHAGGGALLCMHNTHKMATETSGNVGRALSLGI